MSRNGKKVVFERIINNIDSSSSSSESNMDHSAHDADESTLLKGGGARDRVPSYRQEYRVYKRRWFMLASLCALNVSNGMVRVRRCTVEGRGLVPRPNPQLPVA